MATSSPESHLKSDIAGNAQGRIVMPLSILEFSLKNRQINAVAFFLENQENVSCSCSQSPDRGITKGKEKDIAHLMDTVSLLSTNIKKNTEDSLSKRFSDQLLQLCLSHFNKVLQNAIATRSRCFSKLCIASEIASVAMKCLIGLRRYMLGYPHIVLSQNQLKSLDGDTLVNQLKLMNQQGLLQCWEKWHHFENEREIIRDAISNRSLPLVETFLRMFWWRNGEHNDFYEVYTSVGLDWVVECLEEKNVQLASEVLLNIGLNANMKLRDICFNTANKVLRRFLVEELKKRNLLTEEELCLAGFLENLQQTLSCQSFIKASEFVYGNRLWSDDDLKFLEQLFRLETNGNYDEMLCIPGNIEISSVVNWEISDYSCLTLEWARAWSQEMQEYVLIEGLFGKEGLRLEDLVCAKSVWRYMLSRNDLPGLLKMLNKCTITSNDAVSCEPLWSITMDMVEDVSRFACPYVANYILTELAKNGIFCSEELENVQSVVARLVGVCRKDLMLSDAVALSDMLSCADFKTRLILFLVKNNLSHAVYEYFIHLGLCEELLKENCEMKEKQDVSWLPMIACFINWAKNPTERRAVFNASLSNAEFLLTWHKATVKELIASGNIVLGLSTLLCAPGSLREAIQPPRNYIECDWKVDALIVETAVSSDVILGPTLLKFVLEKENLLFSRGPTMYSLLKDSVPFDVRRLFGWQGSQTFTASDCFSEFPYFSHPELVKRHGYNQDLDFTYYLKQGRPTFAFVNFVIQCFNSHGIVSSRKIHETCNKAHSMAIFHFYDEPFAAACVAFMEMLSWNTRGLRIDLQVAHTILSHKKQLNCISTVFSNDQLSAILLFNVVTGHNDAFQNLFHDLEEAVIARCSSINLDLVECAYWWSMVALFCRRHKMPHSATFLRLCAEKNDWLLFTIFAEIHQFPKNQVLEVVNCFNSEQMCHHLQNAFHQLQYFTHKMKYGKRLKLYNKKKLSRDIRATLYARIGVSAIAAKGTTSDRSDEMEVDIPSEDDSYHSESAVGSSDDLTDHSAASSSAHFEDVQSLSYDDIPPDLFGIILFCESSCCPWKWLLNCSLLLKNSILCVIAACYQDSSVLECLCVWLLTSCSINEYSELLQLNEGNIIYRAWCVSDLSTILVKVMTIDQVITLIEGFYYFQPESPLYHLLRFLKLCLVDKMYDASSSLLRDFENSLSKKSVDNVEIIGDKSWWEETSVALINKAFLQTSGLRECNQFLKVVCADHFIKAFTTGVFLPNYNQLKQVLQLFLDKDVHVFLHHLLLLPSCEEYVDECNRILSILLTEKLFALANVYVDIMELPRHTVVIAQMHEELSVQQELLNDGNLQARLTIWNHCCLVFHENRVPKDMIAEFLMDYGLCIINPWEKYYVLHLVWMEIGADNSDLILNKQNCVNLEKEMWLARIKGEMRLISGEISTDDLIVEWDSHLDKILSPSQIKLMTSQKASQCIQCNVQDPCSLQNAMEKIALDRIIGKELDVGNIATALRLSQMFDHKCVTLNIVLTCLKLAEGCMSLHQLDADMRIILEKGSLSRPRKLSSRKISLSLRNSGTSSFPGTPEGPSCINAKTAPPSTFLTVPSAVPVKLIQDDVRDVMEKLISHCETGELCCSRILVIYNIADVSTAVFGLYILNMLGLNFIDIVEDFDDVAVLKAILQSEVEDRFFMAKEYVLANNVDDVFIASFLCEHIVSSLRLITGNVTFDDQHLRSSHELILKPNDSNSTFVQLVKLCRDTSILGTLLIELMHLRKGNETEFSLEVELCIRAHTCFSVACHVEGITRSLQKGKKLCRLLTEAAEFSLMVRLLTGIGRFSEMTYIFDILRENHQFELLFRKGMEKVPDLKVALLDYVKRFHPVDGETFTMLSLHFSMYREIADLLLSDAKSQMSVLTFENMQERSNLHESLENIMQLLADAAESFSKAGCMQQASFCAKQAELVALQLFFRNAGIQILGLESNTVSEFIAKHNKAYESFIVAEAYGRHQDWALALYNNFIVRNDSNYLRDFQEIVTISSSLIEEISRRYQKNSEKTNRMTGNLKILLHMLDDIQLKYNLSANLGFEDLITEILQGDGGSFLKDLIDNRRQWLG